MGSLPAPARFPFEAYGISWVRNVQEARNTPGRTLDNPMIFQDRLEAGRVLASRLVSRPHSPSVAVVALPRGGVPVGYEIARALNVPLDVLPVRKLGAPGNPELAIGAIALGDVRVLDEEAVRFFRLTERQIDDLVSEQNIEIERQEQLYLPFRPALAMQGREVIVTDDGLATGWTMRAAILALRQQRALRIVVAVPVASPSACATVQVEADDVICAETPEWFRAVGQWYREFSQVADDEIVELLQKSRAAHPE